MVPELPPLRTLEAVLAFLRAHERAVTSVVTQDEYTHDVVARWSEDVVLVFDTT